MNDFLNEILFRIGSITITPAKIIALSLVILVTWLLLVFLRRVLVTNKQLTASERGTRNSFYQLFKYLVWVIALSICISIIGFNVTILVASSAALLVGLGLGLQNIFSDLISGLFLLFERKVKVGDIMEVDDIVGKVEKLNLRTSTLLTRDGYNIIVPNHKFITDNVINWSHQRFQRRFQIDIGVSYECDPDEVTSTLLQCAAMQEELITEEAFKPFVRFQDFGENALLFNLMFWTKDIFRVEQVKSQLRYKILKTFKQKAIEIPYPQMKIIIAKPEEKTAPGINNL